mgnify:CR=1 FL=1
MDYYTNRFGGADNGRLAIGALLPTIGLGVPFGPEFITWKTFDLVPSVAAALLGLGVRQLSVAAVSLPRVKRIVRGMHASRAAEAALRSCCSPVVVVVGFAAAEVREALAALP